MIRRIGFFAGAGAGKSTVSARTFADLKMKGYDVEHVSEYVKTMAYEGRFPQSYDQCYIFGHQLHREDVALRHVQTIVTDCPVFLCYAYAKFYNAPAANALLDIVQQFNQDFEALNFYIERSVDYKSKGRFQTFDQAKEFDEFLLDLIRIHLPDCETFTLGSYPAVLAKIESGLSDSKNS